MGFAPSQLAAELLGEAIVKAVEHNQSRTVDRLRRFWRWLCDMAEPPPGTRLVVPGGTVHSGIAVVEHNQVMLLVAVRHGRRAINERSRLPYEYDPNEGWVDDRWPGPLYPGR
jgi:hypothetical protein